MPQLLSILMVQVEPLQVVIVGTRFFPVEVMYIGVLLLLSHKFHLL
jgi:hypothetical protein